MYKPSVYQKKAEITNKDNYNRTVIIIYKTTVTASKILTDCAKCIYVLLIEVCIILSKIEVLDPFVHSTVSLTKLLYLLGYKTVFSPP